MTKKGAKSVSIPDRTDKRTFVITLARDFLPLQLIYGGKTTQSLPKVKFPQSFLLSANLKHFSNTEESIKIINEILFPYIHKQREKLYNNGQAALLILDVFRG